MEETENGVALNGADQPAKTPKQLKKEAEKAAKLAKFQAKQDKVSKEPKSSDKQSSKKEKSAKPAAVEVESKIGLASVITFNFSVELILHVLFSSSSSPTWRKEGCHWCHA